VALLFYDVFFLRLFTIPLAYSMILLSCVCLALFVCRLHGYTKTRTTGSIPPRVSRIIASDHERKNPTNKESALFFRSTDRRRTVSEVESITFGTTTSQWARAGGLASDIARASNKMAKRIANLRAGPIVLESDVSTARGDGDDLKQQDHGGVDTQVFKRIQKSFR
jgi:hypothetical protein